MDWNALARNPLLFRQSEGKNIVTLFCAELAMPAGRDDEVLFVLQRVGHWSGLTTRGELILPEFFAGFDVEGAQVEIHRRGSKDQPTGSYDRPSQID